MRFTARINYYANVINARGQPEGIGSLSGEQVRSRSLTLEFLKDGRRGPVKEIRAIIAAAAIHQSSLTCLLCLWCC
jgi:hypothetical protein